MSQSSVFTLATRSLRKAGGRAGIACACMRKVTIVINTFTGLLALVRFIEVKVREAAF